LLKEIIEKEIYFFKKKNWVNLVNTWPRSWDQDNLIERKLKKKISKYNFEPLKLLAKVMRIRLPNTKQIKKKYKAHLFTNSLLKDEIKKKTKNKSESTQVNLLNSQSCHEIIIT
jgi:hypothetical protein